MRRLVSFFMITVFLTALFDVVDANDVLLDGNVSPCHADGNSNDMPNDDLSELNYCNVYLPSFYMLAEKFVFFKPYETKEAFAFIYTLSLLNNTKIFTQDRPPIA